MKKPDGADLGDETSVPSRLRRAIIAGDLLMVKSITARYPRSLQNPNYSDKSNTSLHLAAAMGNIEIVKLLVSLGHDSCTPNVLSSGYDSAPGISINCDWSTPLHLAASHGHKECVDYLCRHFPQTIDRRDKNGATPLMLAARSSGPSSTNVNITRSTNLVPPTAQRPRSASSPPEDTGAVVTLLMHKANVVLKDEAGNTALHYASAWGNLKTFRLLVSAGVPPLEENDGGWTAADYACTLAATRYCRALVEEFEGLKSGEPPLMKPQMPLKLRVHDLSAGSGGEEGRERSSPISPADTMRSGSGKLGLIVVKPGSNAGSTTTITSTTARAMGEGEDQEDESSDEEVPLTARKISMSDEDPFGSFSGSYGTDR